MKLSKMDIGRTVTVKFPIKGKGTVNVTVTAHDIDAKGNGYFEGRFEYGGTKLFMDSDIVEHDAADEKQDDCSQHILAAVNSPDDTEWPYETEWKDGFGT